MVQGFPNGAVGEADEERKVANIAQLLNTLVNGVDNFVYGAGCQQRGACLEQVKKSSFSFPLNLFRQEGVQG